MPTDTPVVDSSRRAFLRTADVFVFFPKTDVLHMGDVFFNGMSPFIDASTGGTIDGMVDAVDVAYNTTR